LGGELDGDRILGDEVFELGKLLREVVGDRLLMAKVFVQGLNLPPHVIERLMEADDLGTELVILLLRESLGGCERLNPPDKGEQLMGVHAYLLTYICKAAKNEIRKFMFLLFYQDSFYACKNILFPI